MDTIEKQEITNLFRGTALTKPKTNCSLNVNFPACFIVNEKQTILCGNFPVKKNNMAERSENLLVSIFIYMCIE